MLPRPNPVAETSGGDDRQLDFRPGMGMWWEITRSTKDTSGELFEATNWIEPHMPGPPVHVHPTAEESYEVIDGALEVFMNGDWSAVHAGEKAFNRGDRKAWTDAFQRRVPRASL